MSKSFHTLTETNGAQEGAVKAVARAWRSLSSSEKKYWDQMARQDKTRYNNDKKRFADTKLHGGSLVKKLRAKKHPNAPKRPMSAFLMYAQQQRKVLQAEFPDLPNADISKLLGETWRKLSDGEKLQFLMREQEERKVYRAKMSRWNNDQKLINSLKTASERRQQDNEEAYEYDERQDAEGVETVAALKYGAFRCLCHEDLCLVARSSLLLQLRNLIMSLAVIKMNLLHLITPMVTLDINKCGME